jgi:hypothetical protein
VQRGEGSPELTPGEIISLMGDLYGTVDELANAPASQLRDLLAVMQGERSAVAYPGLTSWLSTTTPTCG